MATRRMRFGTWCRKDIGDTRKIVYTFKRANGNTLYFTSEDDCSLSMIRRLRYAWVEKIEDVKNEFEDAWHVYLYEE